MSDNSSTGSGSEAGDQPRPSLQQGGAQPSHGFQGLSAAPMTGHPLPGQPIPGASTLATGGNGYLGVGSPAYPLPPPAPMLGDMPGTPSLHGPSEYYSPSLGPLVPVGLQTGMMPLPPSGYDGTHQWAAINNPADMLGLHGDGPPDLAAVVHATQAAAAAAAAGPPPTPSTTAIDNQCEAMLKAQDPGYTHLGLIQSMSHATALMAAYRRRSDVVPAKGASSDYPSDNPAEERRLAKELYLAIVDFSDKIDGSRMKKTKKRKVDEVTGEEVEEEGGETEVQFVDGHQVVRVKQMKPFEVELLSWEILRATKRAQEGDLKICAWSLDWGYDKHYPNFMARFEDVKSAVKSSKAIVSGLTTADFLSRLAGHPTKEFKRKGSNKAQNLARDRSVKAGNHAMRAGVVFVGENGVMQDRNGAVIAPAHPNPKGSLLAKATKNRSKLNKEVKNNNNNKGGNAAGSGVKDADQNKDDGGGESEQPAQKRARTERTVAAAGDEMAVFTANVGPSLLGGGMGAGYGVGVGGSFPMGPSIYSQVPVPNMGIKADPSQDFMAPQHPAYSYLGYPSFHHAGYHIGSHVHSPILGPQNAFTNLNSPFSPALARMGSDSTIRTLSTLSQENEPPVTTTTTATRSQMASPQQPQLAKNNDADKQQEKGMDLTFSNISRLAELDDEEDESEQQPQEPEGGYDSETEEADESDD